MKFYYFLFLYALLSCSTFGSTYYVNANASLEKMTGLAPDHAFSTIQQACDVAKAGDTVIVAPGTYLETPQLQSAGKKDKPIIFKAASRKENAVIITAADPALRQKKISWELTDRELHLYTVPFDHKPARMLYDGVDLLPYPDLESLRRFRFSSGYPGTQHGFAFENRTLYVRLNPNGKYGSIDPNNHVMAVAPAGNTGGGAAMIFVKTSDANFSVLAENSAFVVLDGFTFETPGVAGVYVRGGDVTVRNCWFRGCRTGVSGPKLSPKPEDRANRVIIEYCDFSQYPAFDDMLDVIALHRDDPWHKNENNLQNKIYWWQRKGNFPNSIGTATTYEIGIGANIGDDWIIRNNRIHDAFEGLSCWATSWSRNLQVYGNLIERCVDNAIEAEDHAVNLHFTTNEVVDVFEPFSWQPLGGLPWPSSIFYNNNLVRVTPKSQNVWRDAGWTPGIWKIGAEESNWKRIDSKLAPDDTVKSANDGFISDNNIIYAPDHQAIVRVQSRQRKFENFHIRKNLFALADLGGDLIGNQGLDFSGNAGVVLNPKDSVSTLLLTANGGSAFPSMEKMGWAESGQTEFTFHLPGTAPANEKWKLPVVGPQP